MTKLNTLQYPMVNDINISKEFAQDILKNNDEYLKQENTLLKSLGFNELKTFSFNSDGFLSLLCNLGLKGKIAISLGETNALYEAGKVYESLGFEVSWIALNKDGKVDIDSIKNLDVDFIFISSYIMDTYVKTNLENIKNLSDVTIISNGTFEISSFSDLIYFDLYKLSGFATSGVIVHNDLFEEQAIGYKDSVAVFLLQKALKNQKFESGLKHSFKTSLVKVFDDDIYFFVDSNDTFDYSLHFGLKGIKARELIRTLALDGVLITNGEGCSLGLSKPSRIIQAMGYDEDTSRNAISLSFIEKLTDEKIQNIVKLMFKRYRQIKVLNG